MKNLGATNTLLNFSNVSFGGKGKYYEKVAVLMITFEAYMWSLLMIERHEPVRVNIRYL